MTRCQFDGSVAATGEHVLPLSVVKLGFVLRGHEFLVDQPDESIESDMSVRLEDQDKELARYDELKGTLALLINHVSWKIHVCTALLTAILFGSGCSELI